MGGHGQLMLTGLALKLDDFRTHIEGGASLLTRQRIAHRPSDDKYVSIKFIIFGKFKVLAASVGPPGSDAVFLLFPRAGTRPRQIWFFASR